MTDSVTRNDKLSAIAGRWKTSGYVIGDPRLPVEGTDIYEVLAGGHFLVHHVDVTVGGQEVRAIEVIGEPDPDSDAYLAQLRQRRQIRGNEAADRRRWHLSLRRGRRHRPCRPSRGRPDGTGAIHPHRVAGSRLDEGRLGALRGWGRLGALDGHHVRTQRMTRTRIAGRWPTVDAGGIEHRRSRRPTLNQPRGQT